MRYRASFLAYAFWVHKNGTLKNWLMRVKVAPKVTPEPTHWVKALSLVLLGIHAGLKQDIDYSTAELVYGTN